MEFKDVVNGRFSCRAFLDKPVSRQVVEQIVQTALRAPSWGNTQPWKVYAVGGETAASIRAAQRQAIEEGRPGNPDVVMPAKFEGALMDRYRALGMAMFQAMGLARDDKEGRLRHYVNNFGAFGAPAMLYVTVPKGQTAYVILDGGAIATMLCLAAHELGLATCLEAALATYPDIIRQEVAIGPDEDLLVGIALGYADPDAPANKFRADRMPLEQVLSVVDMS